MQREKSKILVEHFLMGILSRSWSFHIRTWTRNPKLPRLIRFLSFKIWHRYAPRNAPRNATSFWISLLHTKSFPSKNFGWPCSLHTTCQLDTLHSLLVYTVKWPYYMNLYWWIGTWVKKGKYTSRSVVPQRPHIYCYDRYAWLAILPTVFHKPFHSGLDV